MVYPYISPYSSRLKSLKLLPIIRIGLNSKTLDSITNVNLTATTSISVRIQVNLPPDQLVLVLPINSDLILVKPHPSDPPASTDRVIILWNNLPSGIKLSSSYAMFKAKLQDHYPNKLNSDFSVERPRTWKTLCVKCRSNNSGCCS